MKDLIALLFAVLNSLPLPAVTVADILYVPAEELVNVKPIRVPAVFNDGYVFVSVKVVGLSTIFQVGLPTAVESDVVVPDKICNVKKFVGFCIITSTSPQAPFDGVI